MAFKKVTSGLANINDVINEILTFITTDLSSPWTTETNKDPTGASVTRTTSSGAGRNTWVSIIPAQPNGIAHTGVISPDPDRIYIGMRPITDDSGGLQLNGTGFHDAAASPVGTFWQGQGNLLEARVADDSPNIIAPPFLSLRSNGPFTSLYLFGPNHPSPVDPLIPHYVYFVVEFEPGRYAHGFFGEMKKFVNFKGGWGFSGHARLASGSSDTVDNASNDTMWNEERTGSEGAFWVAAEVGQLDKTGGGTPVRWFKQTNSMTDGGTGVTNVAYAIKQWGHTHHRDFMTGTSQAKLSGFFPLVQPMLTLCDIDSTASKNVNDNLQTRMPACYPEDFFLGDITPFEPGVDAVVGGITVVPFPITSKLGTTPRSNYGGYFYRKRV